MNTTTAQQESDVALIAQVLDGAPDTFAHIVRRYNGYLYKIGRSYGYNHDDTEDLMQDTYISVYKHLGQFEERSTFKTWLTQIMLHACYHKRHTSTNRKESSSESFFLNENEQPMFSDHQEDTDRKVNNNELSQNLEEALLQIPEGYRVVFTLRQLNGLSVKETAETLDLTESNVKVKFHRAKDMLQTELLKVYQPEEIFEFNLIYCEPMVERVMEKIKDLPAPQH